MRGPRRMHADVSGDPRLGSPAFQTTTEEVDMAFLGSPVLTNVLLVIVVLLLAFPHDLPARHIGRY